MPLLDRNKIYSRYIFNAQAREQALQRYDESINRRASLVSSMSDFSNHIEKAVNGIREQRSENMSLRHSRGSLRTSSQRSLLSLASHLSRGSSRKSTSVYSQKTLSELTREIGLTHAEKIKRNLKQLSILMKDGAKVVEQVERRYFNDDLLSTGWQKIGGDLCKGADEVAGLVNDMQVWNVPDKNVKKLIETMKGMHVNLKSLEDQLGTVTFDYWKGNIANLLGYVAAGAVPITPLISSFFSSEGDDQGQALSRIAEPNEPTSDEVPVGLIAGQGMVILATMATFLAHLYAKSVDSKERKQFVAFQTDIQSLVDDFSEHVNRLKKLIDEEGRGKADVEFDKIFNAGDLFFYELSLENFGAAMTVCVSNLIKTISSMKVRVNEDCPVMSMAPGFRNDDIDKYLAVAEKSRGLFSKIDRDYLSREINRDWIWSATFKFTIAVEVLNLIVTSPEGQWSDDAVHDALKIFKTKSTEAKDMLSAITHHERPMFIHEVVAFAKQYGVFAVVLVGGILGMITTGDDEKFREYSKINSRVIQGFIAIVTAAALIRDYIRGRLPQQVQDVKFNLQAVCRMLAGDALPHWERLAEPLPSQDRVTPQLAVRATDGAQTPEQAGETCVAIEVEAIESREGKPVSRASTPPTTSAGSFSAALFSQTQSTMGEAESVKALATAQQTHMSGDIGAYDANSTTSDQSVADVADANKRVDEFVGAPPLSPLPRVSRRSSAPYNAMPSVRRFGRRVSNAL